MNNSTSSTTDNWCTPWTKPIYYYGHLIPSIALFIFGITFNPIALYYFAKSRNFRRSAYSYYFSTIAIVDLMRLILWSLFLLFDYVILKFQFYSFECPTQIFFESVASSISAWLTVALTVERCLAIYRPLQTFSDSRGKRALIVIIIVIVLSCIFNSLVLRPGFYVDRIFDNEIRIIICFYDQNRDETNYADIVLTPNLKRIYLIVIVILRVPIPFMLLLTTNIILLQNVRKASKETGPSRTVLVRHGNHQKITPMIFFSSFILLLTISPRYIHQFYVNFFHVNHCFLFHFVPHIFKTIELFNYSFNVFISIVSGKHGRKELFNMLLCRPNTFQRKAFNLKRQQKISSALKPQERSSSTRAEYIRLNQRLLFHNRTINS